MNNDFNLKIVIMNTKLKLVHGVTSPTEEVRYGTVLHNEPLLDAISR